MSTPGDGRDLFEAEHEAFRQDRAHLLREGGRALPRRSGRRTASSRARSGARPARRGCSASTSPRSTTVRGSRTSASTRSCRRSRPGPARPDRASRSTPTSSCRTSSRSATDEQKQRWLPGCVSGEIITAIAMTEPGAGSDLQGIRTTAVDKGDHYVLNGSKTFISNGILSDLVIVVARTDPEAGHKGISLLVVERGMEGFERGRNLDKVGLKAQDTAELFFDNVQVPKENLLGQEGEGFIYLMMNLPQERLAIAMQAAVGLPGARRPVPGLRQGARGLRRARSGSSSTTGSSSPRWRPRRASRRSSSTTASASTSTGRSTRRSRRWRSGGRPSCRTSWPARPCSCTAATATCSSTRSRRPSSTAGSARSTAARPRSRRRSSGARSGI